MEGNPMAKKGYVQKKYYPVKIICVVNDYSDTATPLIKSIREHTQIRGGIFQTRIYDSRNRSDDRDYIERLPAFHIYNKKAYSKTFYPNTRPIQHIDEAIDACIIDEKRRNVKSISYILSFINWIRKVMTKKTAMERYEEEQSRIKSNVVKKDRRPLPINEWN
jgi:hypothetical protein